MVVDKAEIVSVLNNVKVSRPPDEAEREQRIERLPRNARLYFWRILLATASLTSTIALHPLFTIRAHFY